MEELEEDAVDVAPVVNGKWIHLGGDEWCALRVALSSPLKVVGISLLKNTARIAEQGWTVVLKYVKFDGNPIRCKRMVNSNGKYYNAKIKRYAID